MGRRKRFKNAPKLWERKNGRLCRFDLVDQHECPSEKITSSLADNDSRTDCCEKFSVLDLPDECLIIVLKNLQFFEICNVARVCKRFYQLSCIPTLWNSVDLSSVYNFRSSSLNLDYSSTMMAVPKRRLLLAKFLCARGAALTDIHGEANIFREADMFRCLLNCNVTNLQTVKLRLPYYTRRAQDSQVFRDVLNYLVQKCCNSLKYLTCYVDISSTTVELLGSLQSLEHLNVRFVPPYVALQPDALDAMLSSLPNLKYLKISICQSYHEDTKYVLKSDSLEILDFGRSKQFFISELILPKLHTLHTECLWQFYGGWMPEICLYDIIERGCPQLQTFNEFTSPLPGLKNFNLSDIQKSHFCACSAHDSVRALQ